jgi:hypothetical protein
MKRGDIAAALLLIALLSALVVLAIEFPNYTLSSVTN